MRHAIARTHLHTPLNLLRRAFYRTAEMDMNPLKRAVRLDYILKNVRKINFSFTCYSVSLNQYICFSRNIDCNWWRCTLSIWNSSAKRKVYNRWITILQVVSKIVSIRLTPKLFMSIKSVYESRRCRLIFKINEVNLLFCIIRRNPLHRT